MNKKLLLLGGGGHCKSVLDTLLVKNHYDEIGIVEKAGSPIAAIMGVPIIGVDDDLPKLFSQGFTDAFITLGSVGDPKRRRLLFTRASLLGFHIPNIIDESAKVSSSTKFGRGVFIGKHAVINVDTELGDGAIINTASVIEHDCKLGSFVHIAPGVLLGGGVAIADNTHIGTGAMVKQLVSIGRNTMIGMGSVVLENIPDGVVAYGNPCNIVRHT